MYKKYLIHYIGKNKIFVPEKDIVGNTFTTFANVNKNFLPTQSDIESTQKLIAKQFAISDVIILSFHEIGLE